MAVSSGFTEQIDQAKRRIRIILTVKWAFRALCLGLGLSVSWFVISRLRLVSEPSVNQVILIIGVAGLAGIIFGATRRLSPFETARLIEDRAGMKDRLSSAIEFNASDSLDPIILQQREDAKAAATNIDLMKILPFKLGRESAFLVGFGLLLFGAFFLPTLPMFWSKEKAAEIAAGLQPGRFRRFAFEHLASNRLSSFCCDFFKIFYSIDDWHSMLVLQ